MSRGCPAQAPRAAAICSRRRRNDIRSVIYKQNDAVTVKANRLQFHISLLTVPFVSLVLEVCTLKAARYLLSVRAVFLLNQSILGGGFHAGKNRPEDGPNAILHPA